MKRISLIIFLTLAGCYLAACVFLYFKQRSLLYIPQPGTNVSDPANVPLQNEGETVRIWTRSTDRPEAIIYFGGNSEDVSSAFRTFSKILPKQNLYFVNYRGYGGSTGSPSEAALFSDALAVYDHVHAKNPNVSIIGRSLGSGVAVYVAATRTVEKLVLVTAYDSIVNVAKNRFPFFPVSLILTDRFDSASRANNVKAKTFVILAEDDRVIPRKRSESLISRFPPDSVTVNVVEGTDHNSIDQSPAYLSLLQQFLN